MNKEIRMTWESTEKVVSFRELKINENDDCLLTD